MDSNQRVSICDVHGNITSHLPSFGQSASFIVNITLLKKMETNITTVTAINQYVIDQDCKESSVFLKIDQKSMVDTDLQTWAQFC